MQKNMEVFRIKRQLTSILRQSKTLFDSNGNIIWTAKHPLFKLFHRKYKFYSGNGNLLFVIRNHFTLPGKGKKLTISTPSGTSIISKGNLFDRLSLINYGTQTLATIEKPMVSVRGVITGLSGYTITVQPGVDIPMCFGFVTILDEEREKQGSPVQNIAKINRLFGR